MNKKKPLKLEKAKDTGTKVLKPSFFKVLLLILFVLLVAYVVLSIPKNCREDKTCFNEAFKVCKPAKMITTESGNIYSYKILGKTSNKCVVDIKILSVNPETSQDTKILFEGKSMRCEIPKEKYSVLNLDKIDNTLDYCTGPLKESIYQLMVDRMYNLVVRQLGGITTEIQGILSNPLG